MQAPSPLTEQLFLSFQSILDDKYVPFSRESSYSRRNDDPSKEVRITLDEIKLYNPPTADLIMFKHAGQIIYRFFADEEIINNESDFVQDFFCSSELSSGKTDVPEDFNNYIFIRAFIGIEVNFVRKKEFEKYIEQWKAENKGLKVLLSNFCYVYTYVNIKEFLTNVSDAGSSVETLISPEELYQKLFMQNLIRIKKFYDYAYKNEFILPRYALLKYFDDYGLQSFIDEVSDNRKMIRSSECENKIKVITFFKKEDGESHAIVLDISLEDITVKSFSRTEEGKQFSACFPLEKNVTDKIRQFLSTAWEDTK